MTLPAGSEDKIASWFKDRSLNLDTNFIKKAAAYHDLIVEWSERMNLVSKNDLPGLLERHILDSLVPLKEIPETGYLIDIGSGAGFPAIPISILRPALKVVMVESRKKKATFLEEAAASLELGNTTVWNGRFEAYFTPREKFDIATIRGVKISDKIRSRLDGVMSKGGKVIYYNKFGQYQLIPRDNR